MMNPRTVARWKAAGYLAAVDAHEPWCSVDNPGCITCRSPKDASERFQALVAIDDPFWFRPLLGVVHHLPEALAVRWTQRLDHWQTRRAVRLYRERKGQRCS